MMAPAQGAIQDPWPRELREPHVHAQRPQARPLLQVPILRALVARLPEHASGRTRHHDPSGRLDGSWAARVGHAGTAAGAL